MKAEKTFKINDYLTVKLESNSSVIYVKGKRFLQCKRLVLNVPLENMNSVENLNSIDEIADILEISPPVQETHLSPEAEFWGHCSNIQVWYENGYNTEILRSNLAFPLLKALSEAGDPQARRGFADEIARRLDSEYIPVMIYLIKEGYLSYLTESQIESLSLVEKIEGLNFNNALDSESFIEFLVKKPLNNEREFFFVLEVLRKKNMKNVIFKYFENALKKFPNSFMIPFYFIRELKETGQHDKAKVQLKRLIEKFPTHPLSNLMADDDILSKSFLS